MPLPVGSLILSL